MSLFGTILQKLGLGRDKPADAAPSTATPSASTPVAPPPAPAAAPAASASPAAGPAPVTMSPVDVAAKLEQLAAANPQKLNWRTSIVDLLKLLDLDSSLGARQALARELDCPADKMGDSAQMNQWLHKTVLQRLAANGGQVPQELL